MYNLWSHLCICALWAVTLPQSLADKPHIIFVMIDDLGWNNVGWHNPEVITPNANELVKEGLQLDRHYTYLYCSPSRSSLMSGRLPLNVNQINLPVTWSDSGVPTNMTIIAKKLKQAGYKTHFFGKWHCGMAQHGHVPAFRGFDTSLHYFEAAEDHWTQQVEGETDFWLTDRPAYGMNGTKYGGYWYNELAVATIARHNPSEPLFMYYAFQNNHAPLEVPNQYIQLYPASYVADRRVYSGMTSFWDEGLGNVTKALKAAGMWDNTLLVLSADNGGPIYQGGAANNYPLRGGKISFFEGGVRVAAFVSGGLVPQSVRGRTLTGYIHMCDWYVTFCHLAGVDANDTFPGLPNVDGLNVWPYLSGVEASSPRTEIPLGDRFAGGGAAIPPSALIQGDYKLLTGTQGQDCFQGPEFPNTTNYGCAVTHECGTKGCLFNIRTDPTEHQDLAESEPAILARLQSRLAQIQATSWEPHRSFGRREPVLSRAQAARNGGYWGPWLP